MSGTKACCALNEGTKGQEPMDTVCCQSLFLALPYEVECSVVET
jgi:hypothetical protein